MRVDLNVYLVGPTTADNVDTHMRRAGVIYGAMGLNVQLRHKDRIPDTRLINPKDGKFYESQSAMLASNSNFTQERDCIDVYYMPAFYSDDVRGVTIRPTSQPEWYCGRPPIRPIVILNAIQDSSDTLAHELGHALLDDGTHPADTKNLMAAGSVRTGVELTSDQINKIKNSPFVKP
jgi:hypothetical protein